MFRFEGGSQLICHRLAQPARAAGGAAHAGQPDRGRAAAACAWSRAGYVITAKRVIVAVPPVLAGRIHYSPGLPASRAPAHAARCRRARCSRSPPSTTGRSGATPGLNGTAVSLNGPVNATFDDSPPDGSPGVLFGFVGGDEARTFRAQSKADRRAAVLKNFADYFGAPAAAPARLLRDRLAGRQVVARRSRSASPGPGVLLDHGPAHPRAGRAASTGPAPRPRTTGTATWTAPSGPGSGPRARCWTEL